MKQKEKEESKTTTEVKKSQSKLPVSTTDKQQSNGEDHSEELIERDEVENTPFVMITINNETFGTFGKYRITETYHTKQQCKVELLAMNWNRVIQIMTLVFDMLNAANKK